MRTLGKGDEFVHRCQHCRGLHKFTNAGRHGSGAINYRVTKVLPEPDTKSEPATVG